MPQGYGYGNARLRARRSRLLTQADYEDLLARSVIEEVITALTETPYKQDIETALARAAGLDCIGAALQINLTRTLRQLRTFFEGPPLALVDILLRRWDRHNLLTILRGQSQEISTETVLAALIPVGRLDEVSLRELARQPDLRAAIDLMAAWGLPYASALRRVRARVGAGPDLDQLELALNRFHYVSLYDALRGDDRDQAIVLNHVREEVDLINIRTVLRLARRPEVIPLIRQRYQAADISPTLIEPGGRLSARQLAKLAAEADGPESIIRGLHETPYGPALAAGWQRYQAGESIAVVERALERRQAEQTRAMFSGHPLSIAIPLGYIGSKELEVANLRLIAQAVALDMNREQVRRDLIIV